MFSGMGFCQEDNVVTQSRQGVVTQVDSIGSLLVISDGIEELRLVVGPDVKIQRGTDTIMLDDLESNDSVDVEYYKASDGTLNAVLITDNNIIASF